MATTSSPGDLPPPPSEAEPPAGLPTLAQALTLFGLILALAVFPGTLIVLTRVDTHLVGPILTQILLMLLPLLMWADYFRWNLRLTFRWHRVPWPVILYTVVASLSFIPVAQELELAVERLIPVPAFVEEVFELLIVAHGPLDLVIIMVAVAVIPGMVEELLFRGVVLWALLRRLSPSKAVVGCALLFAAMHFNPWQFVGGLVLGTIYGIVVLWTGSLIPVVIAHALNNATFIILANYTALDAAPPPLRHRLLTGVLGVGVFLYCLWRIRATARRPTCVSVGAS